MALLVAPVLGKAHEEEALHHREINAPEVNNPEINARNQKQTRHSIPGTPRANGVAFRLVDFISQFGIPHWLSTSLRSTRNVRGGALCWVTHYAKASSTSLGITLSVGAHYISLPLYAYEPMRLTWSASLGGEPVSCSCRCW